MKKTLIAVSAAAMLAGCAGGPWMNRNYPSSDLATLIDGTYNGSASAYLTAQSQGGGSPAHMFVYNNRLDLVEMLFERGLEPASAEANSMLYSALAYNRPGIARYLIKKGVSPSATAQLCVNRNNCGTPLYWALLRNDAELVDMILKAGSTEYAWKARRNGMGGIDRAIAAAVRWGGREESLAVISNAGYGQQVADARAARGKNGGGGGGRGLLGTALGVAAGAYFGDAAAGVAAAGLTNIITGDGDDDATDDPAPVSSVPAAPVAAQPEEPARETAEPSAFDAAIAQSMEAPKSAFAFDELYRPICATGAESEQEFPIQTNSAICRAAMRDYARVVACSVTAELETAQAAYEAACEKAEAPTDPAEPAAPAEPPTPAAPTE